MSAEGTRVSGCLKCIVSERREGLGDCVEVHFDETKYPHFVEEIVLCEEKLTDT